MQPYYQDDYVTIYHGDCRDFLCIVSGIKKNLVTDPPYGIGEAAGNNKSRGLKAQPKDYGNDDWDNQTAEQSLMDTLVAMCDKSIIFGGNYYQLSPTKCWLVWDKEINGDFADCELAWTNLDMAVRRLRWRWNGMLQQDMKNKEVRYHPTQKPLPVMKWCLSFLKDNNVIFDPFGGSGTTVLAAKIMGKMSIMCEQKEKYCEIAAKRCQQTVMNFENPHQNKNKTEQGILI